MEKCSLSSQSSEFPLPPSKNFLLPDANSLLLVDVSNIRLRLPHRHQQKNYYSSEMAYLNSFIHITSATNPILTFLFPMGR